MDFLDVRRLLHRFVGRRSLAGDCSSPEQARWPKHAAPEECYLLPFDFLC